MKEIILVSLFICKMAYCQNFRVIDVVTKQPVVYANIDFLNSKGTFTNTKGEFNIALVDVIDSIKISSVGYVTKYMTYNDLLNDSVIGLEQDITNLNEVVIQNKKVKILKHKKPLRLLNLGPIKVDHEEFTSGELGVTYIPFPVDITDTTDVYIKQIIVNTTGYTSEERKYYPFKVNLYAFNKAYHPPKIEDSLMMGIIASRKKGETSKVVINIDDKIKLSKKGVFVSFETLPDKYYPNNTGIDTSYKTPKRLKKRNLVYIGYGAVAKTIDINPKKTKVYSFSLNKNIKLMFDDDDINDYWKMKENFIYDLTIKVEY
ncbi:carboxypeptidase-like regulatory domain-containing protein [Lacinutrix undariae]